MRAFPEKSVFVFKNYKINLNKRKNGERKKSDFGLH